MDIRTHPTIDRDTCGHPIALSDGAATVSLSTRPDMAVDARGLVHGGYGFGAADHAALLAVNDPNGVRGSAELRFVAPVRAGERVDIEAVRVAVDRRKHTVEVRAVVGERVVLTGTLTCFVLDRHVLDGPAGG